MNRRKLLIDLINARFDGNQAKFARAIKRSPGQVNQWVSGHRNLGDAGARHIEISLDLHQGYFNGKPHTAKRPMAPEDRGIAPGPDIKGFVPLISWVQAGNWAAIEPAHDADIAETWLPCPVAHGRRTFILRVSGPSMEPEYQDGCWIFVDPDKEATSGSDIVVRLDDQNEATFKRLIIDRDKKYLQALNPAWPDRIIQVDENATIIGVVIFSGQPR